MTKKNDTQSFIAREKAVCAQNYLPLPVVLTHGHGEWLWDTEGNRYLDMMAAYSAASHGHGHPRLLEALNTQASRLCIPARAYYTDKMIELFEKLCPLTRMDRGLPMNTGAEAVETAIKGARRWGYDVKGIPEDKAEIIVAENNFHGRTISVISFSSAAHKKRGFGPFTPGFKIVPFDNSQAVADAITPNTCAVLFEPIQGEGGIIVPRKGWLHEISQICKDNNVLFILDEIQSGLGRTGKMFAWEHEGVKPDAIILGKTLGGGILPISAFLGRKDVMDVFDPDSHGSTFGGNPLACAVAIEALNILEDEGMIENSAKMGAYFLEQLNNIKSPLIKEVRGLGLWAGLELDPAYISGREFCLRLMKKGILTKETHKTTLRFSPPLTIKQKEIDWALEKITEVAKEVEQQLVGECS